MLGNKSMREILVFVFIYIKTQNQWKKMHFLHLFVKNSAKRRDFIMQIKAVMVMMDSVLKMVLVSV